MLNSKLDDRCQQWIKQARSYLEQPNLIAALDLERFCMTLYPELARQGRIELANHIRNFGRALPRSEMETIHRLLEQIIDEIQSK